MKNNKSIFKLMIIVLLLGFVTMTSVSAKEIILKQISEYTYVKNYHPAGYFEDRYTGTVSIRGLERYNPNKWMYPTESRITYDVQRDICVKSVCSLGEYDTVVRVETIVVQDYWNFGPKTLVFGRVIGSYALEGPYSIDPIINTKC